MATDNTWAVSSLEGGFLSYESLRLTDKTGVRVAPATALRQIVSILGAVGVSGAPRDKRPGDVDDACARDGIKAIQDDLDFAGQ